MYTLISAGVLALDLSRHPNGARVADVVDRVLLLEPADVHALTAAAELDPDRGAARQRLFAASAAEPGVADALAAVAPALGGGVEPAPVREVAGTLSTRLMGRLHDLHAMLLREPPLAGAEVAVVGAVLDAVTAVWVEALPQADPADVALLLEPWDAAVPPFPSPLPACPALSDLLERVARCSRDQWAQLDAAHDAAYGPLAWSQAVHEACRLAAEQEREVEVARWLLAAARTASTTGHTLVGTTPGAMMSVVAAVQAVLVAEQLQLELLAPMTGPCRTVLGWDL